VQLKSFQDLTRFFVAEGVPFRCDEAAQMVELPTRSPPLVGTMAVLWRTGDHLVHFVHLLPFESPVERLAVVEAAVARINHVLAFPGFGIDHEKRRAYFRVVMPRIAGDDSLDSRVIGPTISMVINTTRDFWTPLAQVAIHGASPDGILASARRVYPFV
jgi:hypothetical protein